MSEETTLNVSRDAQARSWEVSVKFDHRDIPEACFELGKEIDSADWWLVIPGHPTEYQVTQEQASALIALAIGEIESDAELNGKLYKLAEQALGWMPSDCRIIP